MSLDHRTCPVIIGCAGERVAVRKTRLRRRGSLARPNIWRLIILMWLTRPSTGPDQALDDCVPVLLQAGGDSTVCRAHQHTAGASKKDLQREPPGGRAVEPADHGLGRSRGGLTTKIHLAVEQGQKPLSVLITAGQRGDSPQFKPALEAIRVPRPGHGRPRRRPDRVRADKAYDSRHNRAYLRRRGIKATIPVPADRVRNRQKLGSRGGRPPKFDKTDYRERHAVECGINSPQAPPSPGHEIRQARRPLRGDRAGRSHERMAVISTTTRRGSGECRAQAVDGRPSTGADRLPRFRQPMAPRMGNRPMMTSQPTLGSIRMRAAGVLMQSTRA